MSSTTHFEEFSSEYYVGRFYIAPYDGNRAVIQQTDHEAVNETIYASDEGITRADKPFVLKINDTYVCVHGDENIPNSTLAVPDDTLDNLNVRNPPELKEVFLPKPDSAVQFILTGAPTSTDA